MPGLTVVNITHGDDADGLTCGALLKRLLDARIVPANYDDLQEALDGIDASVVHLYITDLNLREALIPRIARIRSHAEVTLIDHHPLNTQVRARLRELGVQIVHDLRDCASILVYNQFRDRFEQDAARIATYAAIADMFEDGPVAGFLLDHMDRKFAQHEALILNHALGCNQSPEFKARVIESLSAYLYPHQIKGATEAAFAQLERVVKVKRTVPEKATRAGRLAYMECDGDISTGEVANIIMDALGVDVGLCYGRDGDMVNISMRGERRLLEHLGEIAQRLSDRHGGFGGGHNRAAGAKIPLSHLDGFLADLGQELKPWTAPV